MKSLVLVLVIALASWSAGCSSSPKIPRGATPIAPSTASGIQSASSSEDPSSAPEYATFTPKDGSFTIDVPGKMVELPLPDFGPQLHQFKTVNGKGQPEYGVSWIEIEKSDQGVDRAVLANAFATGILGKGTVQLRKAGHIMDGYPTEMVVFTTPDKRQVAGQIFASEHRLWAVTVAVPEKFDMNRVDSGRFMTSIAVEDPAPRPRASSPSPGGRTPSGTGHPTP